MYDSDEPKIAKLVPPSPAHVIVWSRDPVTESVTAWLKLIWKDICGL